MYGTIPITQLNDFVFCPASIYFHMLYGDTDNILYQSRDQINGTAAHSAIDEQRYSDRKDILLFFASSFCRKVQNVFVGKCNYIL